MCPFEGGCPLLGGSVKRGSTVSLSHITIRLVAVFFCFFSGALGGGGGGGEFRP